MSTESTADDSPPRATPAAGGDANRYQVIARRYRPQTFEELVGQQHVSRVLIRAIETQRVGHAYLFTGARGVGKTSAARIFAKALNCATGLSPTPCNGCEICENVSVGEDVDVLEIDGASNRGIDEIRQLRQNVSVRPSRARFKIYIIDEVHMLTREAFNALLKTLEEPPAHVKFIFCTTEPHKIPVTILSRCQRFDFNGMQTRTITERLEQIVAAEGIRAAPEALAALARRATGSMRDAQSLLEQMLAFCGEEITAGDVQQVLGTASEQRLGKLLGHLVDHDAAAALTELDEALGEGVDLSPLMDQMLGYLRDVLITAAGCSADRLLYTPASEQEALAKIGGQLGTETTMAIMQILDQAKSRMRYSSQSRTILELALVRIAGLERLEEIAKLLERLREEPDDAKEDKNPRNVRKIDAPPAAARKKNAAEPSRQEDDTVAERRSDTPPATPLTAETAPAVWRQVLSNLSELIAENASLYESVAIRAPNRLVVSFRAKYNSCKVFCERAEGRAKIERALVEVTGQPVQLEFALVETAPGEAEQAPTPPPQSSHQQLLQAAQRPWLKRATELFDARPLWIDSPD